MDQKLRKLRKQKLQDPKVLTLFAELKSPTFSLSHFLSRALKDFQVSSKLYNKTANCKLNICY